jgi:ribose-phosphate pyrophosphokinase
MPYIPNARMDRVESSEDVFTLKYFAELLNDLHLNQVVVLDPHSSVSVALINNFRAYTPKTYIDEVLDCIEIQNLMLFYPDEGAMKRYSDTHEYPRTFGMKTRNPVTNRVDSLKIAGDADHIYGNYVLIVDDICSKGDTAMRSARELRKAGAKGVALYVTHCENTILQNDELLSVVDHLYTTDSIFTDKHPKIQCI